MNLGLLVVISALQALQFAAPTLCGTAGDAIDAAASGLLVDGVVERVTGRAIGTIEFFFFAERHVSYLVPLGLEGLDVLVKLFAAFGHQTF